MSQDYEIHQAIGEAVARAEDASGAAALAAAASIDPPEETYSMFDLKYALTELERRRDMVEDAKKELEQAEANAAEKEQDIGKIFENLKKQGTVRSGRLVLRQSYDIMQVDIETIPNFGLVRYRVTQSKLTVL